MTGLPILEPLPSWIWDLITLRFEPEGISVDARAVGQKLLEAVADQERLYFNDKVRRHFKLVVLLD